MLFDLKPIPVMILFASISAIAFAIPVQPKAVDIHLTIASGAWGTLPLKTKLVSMQPHDILPK
jgi:hypothetical protein